MKIGILTYIKEYANHGTNMQSYSTLKAIQEAYPDDRVEIIDYSGWKPRMKPYLSNISANSLRADVTRVLKYKKFFRKELVFSGERLISSDIKNSIRFIAKMEYDVIYVGADTLLELKRAHKDELTAYWLSKEIKSKKFLIAASCNNVTFESLTSQQKYAMQETISDFLGLGVRDDPTYRLLVNVTSSEDPRLEIIPDPTFTYKIDYTFIDNYFKKRGLKFEKPIVCFHLVRDSFWASDLAKRFKKAGYIVASFRPANYADLLLSDLSAHEHAGVYKYFDLVITHRFHDSIFSIKNLTPVIFFPEHSTDVTSFGDSKTLAHFKAFQLDKSGYIADKSKISAELVFEMFPLAIRDFNDKLAHIKETLLENDRKYKEYVLKTKRLVKEPI